MVDLHVRIHRPRARIVCPVLIVAAVGLMLASLIEPDRVALHLYRIGLAFALLAGIGWVLSRTHLSERAAERLRQDGYDDGYSDACDATRVVKIVPSAGAPLPLPSSTHQLGEQADLRRGADRVR